MVLNFVANFDVLILLICLYMTNIINQFKINTFYKPWATAWQKQQNDPCAERKLRSTRLNRVFAVRMKKHWVFSYPLDTLRRLWSDWVSAKADLSLRWAHMPFYWFCQEAAHAPVCVSDLCSEGKQPCYNWTSSRENLSSGFATR